MNIKKVTVFGTGNFGSRLAFHIAFHKVDVTVYDRDYGLLEEARTKFRELGNYYSEHFNASQEKIEAALANIAYSIDITEAAGNAQLIIEAVAEDLDSKKCFYTELNQSAPRNASFSTTSEGLDPTVLAKASGRPDRFLTLHFHGIPDENNKLDIVALPSARQEVLQSVSDFYKNIGMEVTQRQLEQQD